jgi:adenosylhomocysteine nucleosidase
MGRKTDNSEALCANTAGLAGLPSGPIGVLAALPGELGALPRMAEQSHMVGGLRIHQLTLEGRAVLAACGGVGKVNGAGAAALLLSQGAEILLVVGTAGALTRQTPVGTLVHCQRAFQADLAVREHRQQEPHSLILACWQRVCPATQGWFLTADRPVLNPWRRFRLARAFSGPAVADMETGAAARVAERAGVPWGALRVVTDAAGFGAGRSFAQNYAGLAALPADSLGELLRELP